MIIIRKKKIYNLIFVIFFVSLFALIRFDISSIHWGHGDDLGLGFTIFSILDKYNEELLNLKLSQYGDSYSIIKYIISKNYLDFELIKKIIIPFAISENSTYPPLHTYFLSFFSNFNLEYSKNIFSTRVTNIIISTLNFLLIIKIYYDLKKKDHNFNYYGILIIFFSWMYLIYSSLSTFVIHIVLASTILIYILMHEDKKKTLFYSIIVGFFLLILVLFHYQTIIFFPSFFITLLYLNNFSIKNFFSKWGACFLITLAGSIFIYFYFIQNIVGVHWNTGKNSQFNFLCFEDFDLNYKIIACILNFFSIKLFTVIKALISFSSVESLTSTIYTLFILFFVFCSFLNFKNKNKIFKGILVFFGLLFLTWFILILANKAPMSPTRHSLFVILPLSLLFSVGLMNIKILLNKNSLFNKFISISFMLFAIISVPEYFKEKKNRKDPYLEVNLPELIKTHNVKTIVSYDYSWSNLIYYNFINSNYSFKPGPFFFHQHKFWPRQNIPSEKKCNFCRTTLIFQSNKIKDGNLMFISHRPFKKNLYKKKFYNLIYNYIKLGNTHNYDISNVMKTKYIEKNLIEKSQEKVLKSQYNFSIINNTELDFGNYTGNGSNNLIIDIIELK